MKNDGEKLRHVEQLMTNVWDQHFELCSGLWSLWLLVGQEVWKADRKSLLCRESTGHWDPKRMGSSKFLWWIRSRHGLTNIQLTFGSSSNVTRSVKRRRVHGFNRHSDMCIRVFDNQRHWSVANMILRNKEPVSKPVGVVMEQAGHRWRGLKEGMICSSDWWK